MCRSVVLNLVEVKVIHGEQPDGQVVDSGVSASTVLLPPSVSPLVPPLHGREGGGELLRGCEGEGHGGGHVQGGRGVERRAGDGVQAEGGAGT